MSSMPVPQPQPDPPILRESDGDGLRHLTDQSDQQRDRSRIDRRQLDQDRTLLMMQALEAKLSHPSPGREASWRAAILRALLALEQATAQEAQNALEPDGLLSDLATYQPRLRNRVRALRAEYRQLQLGVSQLRAELAAAAPGAAIDVAAVRSELGGLLAALRHQRAKESDLIYEAYYDAFRAELPRDAERDMRTNGRHRPDT